MSLTLIGKFPGHEEIQFCSKSGDELDRFLGKIFN